MISELKKAIKIHGAAQVCVWLGMKDTRTIHTWLSRGKIPDHKSKDVEKLMRRIFK